MKAARCGMPSARNANCWAPSPMKPTWCWIPPAPRCMNCASWCGNASIAVHASGLSLLFQSFGFRHGLPGDSDFVFDARGLPNPYWEPKLRALTGKDPAVARFLDDSPVGQRFVADLRNIPGPLDPAVRVLQPPIPDGLGGLHRRLPPLGVRGGEAGRAFPRTGTRSAGAT